MEIKKIKAKKKSKATKKRVAAYCRVSSERDAPKDSLSNQISHYNELISKRLDWEFAGIYVDEAKSGTKYNRPDFQRMLQDCRDGKIDMIITKSIVRFARNTLLVVEESRKLKELGIDIFFELENIHTMSAEGEILLTAFAMYAEDQAKKSSEQQKWKIRKKYENGIPSNNNRCLGYEGSKGDFTIIPEEAEIVKEAYKLYLSGLGKKAIANIFNEKRYSTVSGHAWTPASLTRILQNERYVGDLILQKTFREDFRTKRKVKNTGQKKKYYIQDNHEAIISREMFDTVQKERERRRRHYQKDNSSRTLSKYANLITCSWCGKKYIRETYYHTSYSKKVLICHTRRFGQANLCMSPSIDESDFDSIVKDILKTNSLENIDIRASIREVICTPEGFTFIMQKGQTIEYPWQHRPRKIIERKNASKKSKEEEENKHAKKS